ncbi:MAG: hypothetical protein ABR562_03590 [Thermoplasmatota archaeon]
MSWKELMLPVAEFVGGVAALRVAVPMESVVLTCGAMTLTMLGLVGVTRKVSKPQSRPYQPEP